MNRTMHLVLCGALVSAVCTPALGRISLSGEETIKGEVETWVDLDSRDDVGLETTAEVTLNGKTILQEKDVLSIRIDWEQPKSSPSERLLLAINQTYPRLCETVYRLLDLSKPTSPLVTARFGNCHAEPVIVEKGKAITFYFPRFYSKAEVAYRYTPESGLKQVPVTREIRGRKK